MCVVNKLINDLLKTAVSLLFQVIFFVTIAGNTSEQIKLMLLLCFHFGELQIWLRSIEIYTHKTTRVKHMKKVSELGRQNVKDKNIKIAIVMITFD